MTTRVTPTAALLALLLTAGCTTGDGTASERDRPSTSAAATDAAGRPIVPPYCIEPGEGRYVHAAGPSEVTPVLLLGTGRRGVVVGAQANGDICQTLAVGRELVGKGYHVALFDWTDPYPEAMRTAARALIADGAAKVVLGGFSRGALVALGIAPDLGSPIAGVFSISGGPSPDEGFGTIASLSRYTGPILLISSADDTVFPSGTNAAIAKAHTGPETVHTVAGSAHALALLDGPDAPKVRAALYRFLSQVLR